MFNEIARVRSEDFLVEEEVTIEGNKKGIVKVSYYLERVLEHKFLEDGTAAFCDKIFANVTSVSTPIQIWLGYTSTGAIYCRLNINNTNYSNNDGNIYDGIDTLGHHEGIELITGETHSNVLLYSYEMTEGIGQNFIDGGLPLVLNTRFTMAIASAWSGSTGYYRLGDEIKWQQEDDLGSWIVPIQDKSTQAIMADNFTDETTNPSINYSIFYLPGADITTTSTTYEKRRRLDVRYSDYSGYRTENITIQIGLSLDGETLDIPYRDAPVDGNYTFSLTEEELDKLRQKAQASNNVPIYYMMKTTRVLHYNSNGTDTSDKPAVMATFYSKAQRIFTVVGCKPVLNPTVVDVNSDTITLTGNPNIFVRYESMVEFTTGAVASKYASIVSQSVQCGSKVIYNLSQGIIDDIETGSFIFNATDSRGQHADQVVVTNTAMIEYVKPTCNQKVIMSLSGETGAVITLTISGECYNGSFGLYKNKLVLMYRYKQGSADMGEWTRVTATPTFNGNTYEVTLTFEGLSYDEAYTFQCRAKDLLNTVESSQYTARLLPVFDWSEEDFNFNVPVNISADKLTMNKKTIIRHNKTANNTVISATGGRIYVRPGGDENTYGETIYNSNGDVTFSGTVSTKALAIDDNTLADYVVEAGETEMGSNGTWYWQKWASGKAEAWGCRNFGNMAVTTAWGNLYRSAILTQDLPDNVFITTPDVININIVNGNYGGWICKHENLAPSAATTGSFIWVRPASATISPTYIGFHIIGIWQ